MGGLLARNIYIPWLLARGHFTYYVSDLEIILNFAAIIFEEHSQEISERLC